MPQRPRRVFAAQKPPGLRVILNAADNTEAEVTIYDEIGPWFATTARDFVDEIKALDVSTLHLRINSPGGSVFDGLAIANALRAHKANVITHVDGLAASIASVIALAGNEVRMAENAFLMIHDPWTFAMGNARELRKLADDLDYVGGSIVGEYVRRTGASEQDVRDWMAEETWFNAEDAKAEGFIDTIEGVASSAQNKYDLSCFRNTPRSLLAGETPPRNDKRDLERTLRDAGYSRAQARAIVAQAAKVTGQCDAGEGDLLDIAGELQSLLASITSH